MFLSLWRHRSLVIELTKREFSGKYRGSFGGAIWSLIQPLFMLAVYTVAFGVILKARWGFSGSTVDYALMLFAGLIVFNLFSEVLTKSTMLIVGQPNFVKKVVFPLELLPVITVFTALVHAFIGIAVWLVGYQLLIGTPKLTILYFPLVLFCFLPVLLGVGWLLSSIGVIFRDISQITSMLNHVLLFLTPIFFSIEAAPPLLQKFLLLNPLTFIVEQFRLILFYGEIPMFNGLAIYFVLATLFAWLSFMLFRRLRPNFANMV
ncbi:ABC transporter permease [Yersinia mollaretii]|uniref:Transport permease protein n=2 Tax=Yersinia mollaretii TaxID=33060 RepID=A0AA44HZ32_YERMO|nr:ABC transporter permease [Yersinia mollaretii]EEQ12396.1 ABC-type polysaccharide/polyol phosphate export system, permease component [Yersinia mollaretii ATCC 43969]NIL21930.1 ABC transporter permease [Yersinia mollaretii]QKJ03466.1 ABC transporter permease [Yersinia mollaretii ATCC 43969]CNK47262.1 lipopolysaccharide transport system permease [Yersinia enterocolitica]